MGPYVKSTDALYPHRFVDPQDRSPKLYLILIFGINGPWTLRCVRQYILVPTDNLTRNFVIIYDAFVSKPFFRNHLILVTFSILGFSNSTFFTLMLLDIVNNSHLLSDMFMAVMDPMPKLGLVLFFIVVVATIYAAFGMEFLPDTFTFGDDEDTGCYSMVACTWLILYKAVRIAFFVTSSFGQKLLLCLGPCGSSRRHCRQCD